MKFMPAPFGHFPDAEEWRVDRRDPRPPRFAASVQRRRRRGSR